MTFYLFHISNFAANQLVSDMEIITFESKAYKELDNKITAIADYIFNHLNSGKPDEDEIWVDSYEVIPANPMKMKFGWTVTKYAHS